MRGLKTSIVVGALLVMSAAFGAWWVAQDGIVIGLRDGPVYLSSAENLSEGNGFVMSFGDPGKAIDFDDPMSPVTDYPIGYPAALSGLVRVGMHSRDAARALSVFAIALITGLVWWYGQRNELPWWGSVLGAGTAACLTLPYATSAVAEPLYGLLLVAGLGFLSSLRRQFRWFALIGASICASAALVTRTIGIALVGTVFIFSILCEGSSRQRLARGMTVCVTAAVPVGFLIASGGSRVLAWHPPGITDLKVMVNAFAGWLIPAVGPPVMTVGLSIILLGGLILWVRAEKNLNLRSIEAPLWRRGYAPGVISAAAHLGVLLASRLLFDAQNVPGMRLLYPVALSLLVAAVQGYPEIGSQRIRLRKTWSIVLILTLVSSLTLAIRSMRALSDDPHLFTSMEFADSGPVAAVLSLPITTKVFSNVPDGLWVIGRGQAFATPVEEDPLSLEENPLLAEETSQLAAEIDRGAVVFFRRGDRDYLISEGEIRALASCVVIDDGRSLILANTESPLCP